MATADSTIEGSSAFPEAKLEARAGVLDGLTIARFVRCYSGGAGLEYDVEILNRALCERNRIHIVQIQMAQPGESMAVDVRAVGRGRITSIPLERETLPVSRESADSSHCTRSFRGLKTFIRDRLIFGPVRMEGLQRDYPVYYRNIISQINRCFRWQGPGNLEVQVQFVIRRDGTVNTRDLDITRESGNIRFDYAAMAAVECAGQGRFGPLPDEMTYDQLPVLFNFRPPG